MSVIGMVLMVLGPLLAAVLVIAVPALLGYMAYDAITSKPTSKATAADSTRESLEAAGRRIQVERGVARAFVILGGAFWGLATFAGLYTFQETGWQAAAIAAAIPLFAALVTLVIGWYAERLASIMLVLASAAVIYFGVVTQFEAGVWALMTIALIGPMMTAAAMFWMARRESVALAIRLESPELALATADIS